MIDIFEEETLKLDVKLKKGEAKDKKAKFIFVQDGKDLPPKEVDVKSGWRDASAKVEYKLPKVEDTKNGYKLEFRLEFDGKKLPGNQEWAVWPRNVGVKTFDADDKALPFARCRIYRGDRILDVVKADKDGAFNYQFQEPGDCTITGDPPFDLTEWKSGKDQGRAREAKLLRRWQAEIVKPEVVSTTKPVRQYVNLDPADNGQRGEGFEILIEVGAAGDRKVEESLRVALAGDEIFIEATFSRESKRDHPLPALSMLAEAATVTEEGKKHKGKVVLANDGGTAFFKLNLGRAGGDTCELKLGTTKEVGDATLKFENWRKLFYQVTRPKGFALPDLDLTIKCWEAVFVELERTHEVVLEEGQAPNDGKMYWVKGEDCGKTKGKQYFLIGAHNRDSILATYFTDPKSPRGFHISCAEVQCDVQRKQANDLKYPKGEKIKFPGASGKVPGMAIDIKKMFGAMYKLYEKNFMDGGTTVTYASWNNGKQGVDAKGGEVPSTHLAANYADYKSKNGCALIRLTDEMNDAATAGDTLTINVNLRLTWGPFAGDSDAKKSVILTPDSTREMNDTICHELGHCLKLTELPSVSIPGIGLNATEIKKKHGRCYSGKGHNGGHCADGMSESDFGKLDNFESKKLKCVLYGEGGGAGPGLFCKRCTEILKSIDMLGF